MTYLLHILSLIGIFSICAAGANIVTGYAGLVSIAQAAFFGVGAYTTALVAIDLNAPFPFGLVAAMTTAAVAAMLLAALSLRLGHDYFVIATIGFQLIVWSVLNNWQSVTRGAFGIPGIPPLSLMGFAIRSQWAVTLLILVSAAAVFWVCHRLVNSPYGRVLKSIREDEPFAQTLGKNTLSFKISAFAVCGALAGVAGCLYAHFSAFIDPTSFTISESVFILSIVIIGGAGNVWGPAAGAVVLVALPEILRFVGLPSVVAANVRQILYGTLLLVMLMVRPRGLIGKYNLGR
ncbi:MAG TPA: branched-chain amino acid ABC transporter permease [Pyrinomonadaceae bacterium]|nr:branched-chain amino acid ABC transporter permease [Pyrinomonadaceae bacterium]